MQDAVSVHNAPASERAFAEGATVSGATVSPVAGVSVLAAYGATTLALTWALSRRMRATKTEFLVAGRALRVWEAACSIAATWIWAPALFLASQKAYTQGIPGVFWFTVPNVLCLILFAHFADRIRALVPEGFTLSHYMRTRYSRRVQALYLLQMAGLAACSFAVQLLAGGKVIASLTGLPFVWVTVALAGIALSYSVLSGLRASVITDHAQMVIILGVLFVVVPWAVVRAGGLAVVGDGLGGQSGAFRSLFSASGGSVAWSFGISVTIGLLAGPFGDQSFWQRAFAIERDKVKRAFVWGALLFALVPLLLCVLGFLAAGQGWQARDPALVNLEAIERLLPAWVLFPMFVVLLSGLVSTLDSNLCAVASLCGHDGFARASAAPAEEPESGRVVAVSRWSMLGLALAGLVIANLPGMEILYLFLFYGTLRASTFLPTVLSLVWERTCERGVFWGILAAIAVGLPVFAYGNFWQQVDWAVAGSLLTVLLSGLLAGAWSRFGNRGRGSGDAESSTDVAG